MSPRQHEYLQGVHGDRDDRSSGNESPNAPARADTMASKSETIPKRIAVIGTNRDLESLQRVLEHEIEILLRLADRRPDQLDTPIQTAQREQDSGFSTQEVPVQVRDPVRTIAHILRATVIILSLCALLWILAGAFIIIILSVLLAVMLHGLGRTLHVYTRLYLTAAVLL